MGEVILGAFCAILLIWVVLLQIQVSSHDGEIDTLDYDLDNLESMVSRMAGYKEAEDGSEV